MKVREILMVWLFIFLIWTIYRFQVSVPEWMDELLVKPLVFLGPVFYMILVRQKKSFATVGFSTHPRNFFFDAYIGVVLGILFAFEGLWANYFKYGDFTFNPNPAVAASAGIVPFLITNLATAISEEILGRGYLYQRLSMAFDNQHQAAIFSSFLFLLLHLPILITRLQLPSGPMLVYLSSVFFLSITNCYILSLRRSLVIPILIHLFWNITISLYL